MGLENLPLKNILETGVDLFYAEIRSGVPREVAIDLQHKWLDDLAKYQGVPLSRVEEARDRIAAFLAPYDEEDA